MSFSRALVAQILRNDNLGFGESVTIIVTLYEYWDMYASFICGVPNVYNVFMKY